MAIELYIIKYGENTSLCYKEDGEYFDLSNPMLSFVEGEDEFTVVEPDKSYETKKYNYRGQKVFIKPALYRNNWPAILEVDPIDTVEYDCLTVNLEDDIKACGLPDRTFIDINHHPEAMVFLEKNGFIKDMCHKRRSGFVEYPLVSINLPLLFQHEPKVFIDYCLNTLGLSETEESSEEKVISDNIDNYLSNNDSSQNHIIKRKSL